MVIFCFRSEIDLLHTEKLTTERAHQKELKEIEKEANERSQHEVNGLKEKLSKVSFVQLPVTSLSPLFI